MICWTKNHQGGQGSVSNVKQVHYDISELKKKDCNINLIYGEKSNGKSYQVKHRIALDDYFDLKDKIEQCIEEYMQGGFRFIILRRWREDITNMWAERYFAEVDVKKMTKGEYSIITVYKKEIYFANVNDEGKVKRGEKIGYLMALSTEQHYSSGSFLDVKNIIFEEFMERGGMYIPKEPERLLIFYNTVDRKRGTTKLWLVGNTISRVCPYLTDWNLQPILRKMKQGDIEVVEIPTENNVIRLGIEYCKSSGGKQTTFGQVAKMIETGSWQTDIQPKLPKSLKEYEQTFKVGFQYSGFRFVGVLLVDKSTKEFVWFIYPRQKEFTEKNMLVFSDCIKQSQYWQRNIYNLTFKNERLERALSTFRESNIFYSDDLTGTDFKSAIDFSIIK